MPRAQKPSGKSRHDPLIVQLGEDEVKSKYGKISEPGKRKKSKKQAEADEAEEEVKDSIF
jgi:essential nuclear protein 1